jgi:hypothetical protein
VVTTRDQNRLVDELLAHTRSGSTKFVTSSVSADSRPAASSRHLDEWIRSPAGPGFEIRRERELYAMTSNPYGCVQRRL